jgi:RNA polymerase sigma factor (TIGR02999 family)
MDQTPTTLDRLVPVVYDHLRMLARHRLQRAGDLSLDTTGLVHEAYMRIAESSPGEFADREHFFALASRVMRNVLVDHARARSALKRGGAGATFVLREDLVAAVDLDGVLELDDAMRKLEAIDPRQSAIVECRYFGGLSLEETAAALHVSLATVKRELRLARAWLADQLTHGSA